MTNKHGDFVWYELMTDDPEAAARFYEQAIGLKAKDSGMKGYQLFSAADGVEVGGMMAIDEEMKAGGAQPAWLGYIGVDDVDAAVDTIAKKGGKILLEPRDIPDVGRFAMATDPSGAPFYVMRGDGDGDNQEFSHERRAGHVGWNEHGGRDLEADLAFYEAFAGWDRGERMQMEHSDYQMVDVNGRSIGGFMTVPDETPAHWSHYFWTDGVEGVIERTKQAGGSVMMGPFEIPGGDVIMFGTDPQGASFCAVGPR